MILEMALCSGGLSLAAAAGYVGHDVVRGNPMDRPMRPGLLAAFSIVAMLVGFAGQIAGFWLFGAWWAAAVAAWFIIGFPVSVEFLKARQPEGKLAGVWLLGLVGYALTAGGVIMKVRWY